MCLPLGWLTVLTRVSRHSFPLQSIVSPALKPRIESSRTTLDFPVPHIPVISLASPDYQQLYVPKHLIDIFLDGALDEERI